MSALRVHLLVVAFLPTFLATSNPVYLSTKITNVSSTSTKGNDSGQFEKTALWITIAILSTILLVMFGLLMAYCKCKFSGKKEKKAKDETPQECSTNLTDTATPTTTTGTINPKLTPISLLTKEVRVKKSTRKAGVLAKAVCPPGLPNLPPLGTSPQVPFFGVPLHERARLTAQVLTSRVPNPPIKDYGECSKVGKEKRTPKTSFTDHKIPPEMKKAASSNVEHAESPSSADSHGQSVLIYEKSSNYKHKDA